MMRFNYFQYETNYRIKASAMRFTTWSAYWEVWLKVTKGKLQETRHLFLFYWYGGKTQQTIKGSILYMPLQPV